MRDPPPPYEATSSNQPHILTSATTPPIYSSSTLTKAQQFRLDTIIETLLSNSHFRSGGLCSFVCVFANQDTLRESPWQARLREWQDSKRPIVGAQTPFGALVGYVDDEIPEIMLLPREAGSPEDWATRTMLEALTLAVSSAVSRHDWEQSYAETSFDPRPKKVQVEDVFFRRENDFGLFETTALGAVTIR